VAVEFIVVSEVFLAAIPEYIVEAACFHLHDAFTTN
jgi:hypothetical protein